MFILSTGGSYFPFLESLIPTGYKMTDNPASAMKFPDKKSVEDCLDSICRDMCEWCESRQWRVIDINKPLEVKFHPQSIQISCGGLTTSLNLTQLEELKVKLNGSN